MNSSSIFGKLNLHVILLHLLALFFLYGGFKRFVILIFPEMLSLLNNKHTSVQLDPVKVAEFGIWMWLSGGIGLIVGLVFSLIISFKYKWHWFNSLVAFLAAALLFYFFGDILMRAHVVLVFPFSYINTAVIRLIVGSIWLIILATAALLLPGFLHADLNKPQKQESQITA